MKPPPTIRYPLRETMRPQLETGNVVWLGASKLKAQWRAHLNGKAPKPQPIYWPDGPQGAA